MKQLNFFKKNNHLKALTHIQNEKSIRRNHIIKNLKFIDLDNLFNDYITNHIEKFEI